jgi:hypothetical protein
MAFRPNLYEIPIKIIKIWLKDHKALRITINHYINVVAINNWAHWLS